MARCAAPKRCSSAPRLLGPSTPPALRSRRRHPTRRRGDGKARPAALQTEAWQLDRTGGFPLGGVLPILERHAVSRPCQLRPFRYCGTRVCHLAHSRCWTGVVAWFEDQRRRGLRVERRCADEPQPTGQGDREFAASSHTILIATNLVPWLRRSERGRQGLAVTVQCAVLAVWPHSTFAGGDPQLVGDADLGLRLLVERLMALSLARASRAASSPAMREDDLAVTGRAGGLAASGRRLRGRARWWSRRSRVAVMPRGLPEPRPGRVRAALAIC